MAAVGVFSPFGKHLGPGWVLCGSSSAPRCALGPQGCAVTQGWAEFLSLWLLAVPQCGDSRRVQGISYPIWKNLTSCSSWFALNLHSKIRLKGVSDLNILIQPFPSMLRQALQQLCNVELFFPASSQCPKQLENLWKGLEQCREFHPRAGRAPLI